MKRGNSQIETPVSVLLVRSMSNREDNLWRLEIQDESSRVLILEANLDNEQLADLMSARHAQEVPATLYISPNHGLKHENKTVLVHCNGHDVDMQDMLITAQCEEDETGEGWVFDDPGKFNRHRYDSKNKTYSLIARRYVKK